MTKTVRVLEQNKDKTYKELLTDRRANNIITLNNQIYVRLISIAPE